MTLIWSGVVAFIVFKLVDLVISLRVPEDEEREGLDITFHGETAYSQIACAPAGGRAAFGRPLHFA